MIIINTGRGTRQRRMMRIQQTQRNGTKRNQPTVLVLCDADEFANEGFTHEDEFPMPSDCPVGSYTPVLDERRIFNISKPFRIRPWREHVTASWRYLSQGFMRAHGVVHRNEAITHFLLSLGIGSRRLHGLLLDSTMQTFM